MFLRSSVVKKSGKVYRYWKLVETVRTDSGPRQRVVAHLGDLSGFTAEDWSKLAVRMGEPDMAASLQRRVRQGGRQGRPPKWTLQDRLSDPSDAVTIRLSATSWAEPIAFGDVYAGLMIWKQMGLGALVSDLIDESRAKVKWSSVAALIAVNRLVEPMPEWHMVGWWRRTALPQLLGIPLSAINDDRLYRCLDLAGAHKRAIEDGIAEIGKSWFGQSYRYLLYDLTSTYFEGQMDLNPKAKRGYSRDHRPDCKQITIGAVVDREGFPVGFEVMDGNTRDDKTVGAMLDKLRARFGLEERTLCMDRGMVSEQTLPLIRASQMNYVLADRRDASQSYCEQVKTGTWKVIRSDKKTSEPLVEVQEVGSEDGDRLILVRSKGCRDKEHGIHERKIGALTEDLKKLEKSVAKGRLVNPEKIDRRIGAVLARHPGISRWVSVRRETSAAADAKNRPRQNVHWEVVAQTADLAKEIEGVYLLRTNVQDSDAGQVWEDYVTLVRVEDVFRTLKHDLQLRPVCHQLPGRADAHVLFSWIAYAMYWILERVHRQHGGELSGRQLLEVLRGIYLGTIRLQTVQGMKLELERISVPRKEEQAVLHSLRLALPRPRTSLSRVDLTLPDQKTLFEELNECSD